MVIYLEIFCGMIIATMWYKGQVNDTVHFLVP